MDFRWISFLSIILATAATTQSIRGSREVDAGPVVDHGELARQNRITQQILQYYLERKLFPQLKRPSRPPNALDILPRTRKRDDYNPLHIVIDKLNSTRWHQQQEQEDETQPPPNQETLEKEESEQISFYKEQRKELGEEYLDQEEQFLQDLCSNDVDCDFEDCPNCVDDSSSAPTRWTMPLLKLGDKRYYLGIFFKANYFRATQFCRFHGMHLASISSQDENDKLEKYIKDFGLGNEHFWTSGTDLADEGKFFWMSTGRPLTFTNWNAGEPNNFVYESGEEENCLELWNRDGKGLKWNDSPCSFETFFVCEVHQ